MALAIRYVIRRGPHPRLIAVAILSGAVIVNAVVLFSLPAVSPP
ncbi:MAG: hypothetical protein ABI323_09200 [Solirubrobacteraceae bacterium]